MPLSNADLNDKRLDDYFKAAINMSNKSSIKDQRDFNYEARIFILQEQGYPNQGIVGDWRGFIPRRIPLVGFNSIRVSHTTTGVSQATITFPDPNNERYRIIANKDRMNFNQRIKEASDSPNRQQTLRDNLAQAEYFLKKIVDMDKVRHINLELEQLRLNARNTKQYEAYLSSDLKSIFDIMRRVWIDFRGPDGNWYAAFSGYIYAIGESIDFSGMPQVTVQCRDFYSFLQISEIVTNRAIIPRHQTVSTVGQSTISPFENRFANWDFSDMVNYAVSVTASLFWQRLSKDYSNEVLIDNCIPLWDLNQIQLGFPSLRREVKQVNAEEVLRRVFTNKEISIYKTRTDKSGKVSSYVDTLKLAQASIGLSVLDKMNLLSDDVFKGGSFIDFYSVKIAGITGQETYKPFRVPKIVYDNYIFSTIEPQVTLPTGGSALQFHPNQRVLRVMLAQFNLWDNKKETAASFLEKIRAVTFYEMFCDPHGNFVVQHPQWDYLPDVNEGSTEGNQYHGNNYILGDKGLRALSYSLTTDEIVTQVSTAGDPSFVNLPAPLGQGWFPSTGDALFIKPDPELALQRRYGIRSFQSQPVVNVFEPAVLKQYAKCIFKMKNAFINHVNLSYTLRPDLRVGRNVFFMGNNKLYYILGIDHSFTIGGMATTEIKGAYGHSVYETVGDPWAYFSAVSNYNLNKRKTVAQMTQAEKEALKQPDTLQGIAEKVPTIDEILYTTAIPDPTFEVAGITTTISTTNTGEASTITDGLGVQTATEAQKKNEEEQEKQAEAAAKENSIIGGIAAKSGDTFAFDIKEILKNMPDVFDYISFLVDQNYVSSDSIREAANAVETEIKDFVNKNPALSKYNFMSKNLGLYDLINAGMNING